MKQHQRKYSRESLGTGVLDLLLEDELHQVPLVLEGVTLGAEVQIVVQMLVNLLGLTVLSEQTAENANASHPQNFLGHTSITSTQSLSGASVTSLQMRSYNVVQSMLKAQHGATTVL